MRKRPNLVLLLTDDQRFDTIQALGNPLIHICFTCGTHGMIRRVRGGKRSGKGYSPIRMRRISVASCSKRGKVCA